jgi:signal transduction histidine kinase/ligand-binding sensor domain-containing protein
MVFAVLCFKALSPKAQTITLMPGLFAEKRGHQNTWLRQLKWALIFLLVYPASQASAQYQFDLWNTDQGLPQNDVQAILQTRDGYLWLTTSDGLVRFDGVRFTVFNKGNTKGLLSNRLTALYEGRDGSLWIGTEDRGLIRYHERGFTTYTTAEGLKSNWIWAITENVAGQMLVLTRLGVMIWNGERFIPYRSDDGVSERIYRWPDRMGGLSFFDDQVLHVFDGRAFRIFNEDLKFKVQKSTDILKDQHGTHWFVAKDARLISLKDGVFSSYVINGLPPEAIITALFQEQQGAIWIGTARHGLGRLKDGALTIYSEVKDSVRAIYKDREGTLWIGAGDGLRRVRRQDITVYAEKDGLLGRGVNSIFEDREGSIWLGTWRGGLNRLKDGRMTSLGTGDGLSGNLLTAVYEDRDGNLWVGTHDRGINLYKDGKFTVYGTKDGLGDQGVASIYQDRAGTLWIGTYSGLTRFRDGAFTNFAVKDGLLQGGVQVIQESRTGELWLGTQWGLSRYSNGKFTNYTERDGLSSDNVRAIYEDRAGILWVGTYDGGLNRFVDGKFTKYTTNDGLFNNGVFQILEDDRGYFWMSCNLGIYRVKRQELEDFAAGEISVVTSIAYGKKDGMLSAECNGGHQPAGVRTRDGRMWFPTQDGAAVIDPQTIEINAQPPPVVVEDCLLDNKPVNLSGQVEIAPGQQNIEIRYTGLSFINSEQVHFKYKLEGLDDDWIDAGSRRSVSYSYLPPGTYTFRVTAANRDGIWNSEGAILRLNVRPPFWRMWWFISLAALCAMGLVFLIYERRVARLRRARAAQEEFSRQLIESQENERKRIAAELHDSLGQNLLIIKNRALLGLTPDAPPTVSIEQLNEISSTATQAIEEVREIARNLRPYKLDRLGLTKALESIIEQTANSSEINFSSQIDPINGLFSKEAEINLYRIVQESLNNILKHSQATDVDLRVQREAHSVRLEIQDNGVGFDTEAVKGEEAERRGFGLAGMAERARIIGGKYMIRSSPGHGMTITLKIELRDNRHEP